MQSIYLDNAATTPVDPKVFAAMKPYFSEAYGNPSSLHLLGLKSKQVLDAARVSVAKHLNARKDEVFFTAGGTESVNIAIQGAFKAAKSKGFKDLHIITSSIEHASVLECVRSLKLEGVSVTEIPVNIDGLVDISTVSKAIKRNTFLVSIMYANNEIGSIQPIIAISKLISGINAKRSPKEPRVLFHTDACQAVGYLDINVHKLGVDLLSGNASKMYGPKQVGFLYVAKGTDLMPVIYGGGQERNIRSGTENVPGIVGLAKALELVEKEKNKEVKRVSILRDYFIAQIEKKFPKAKINGPRGDKRLPNNVHAIFSGTEGESLVLYLSAKGIYASSGSACDSRDPEPSHVLKAIGVNDTDSQYSIRFSLGKFTTKKDIDTTVKVLGDIIPLIHN